MHRNKTEWDDAVPMIWDTPLHDVIEYADKSTDDGLVIYDPDGVNEGAFVLSDSHVDTYGAR